jgi:hypothetical protein
VQFIESFVFGKLARFVLGPFSETFRSKARAMVLLDECMMNSLELLSELLANSKPRQVFFQLPTQVTRIFTDGACEQNGALTSCGAVVFEESAGTRFWFSFLIPEWLVKFWQSSGDKAQVVAEAEMLPVIITRRMISTCSSMTLVLHFIDNDGVADSLISGFSRVRTLQHMLRIFVLQEGELCLTSWIARVASHANPADAPSRMVEKFEDGEYRGTDKSCEAGVVFDGLVAELTRA